MASDDVPAQFGIQITMGNVPELMNSKNEGTSAVERVLKEVLDGLSRGRYVPGQRLVAADLAARLGTSPIPVREALHILAGRGIVEFLPRRGARIRELSAKEFLDFLRVWRAICLLNFTEAAETLASDQARLQNAAELISLGEIRDAIRSATRNRVAIDFFNAYVHLYDVCAKINENPFLQSIRDPLPVELYYRHVADFLPGPYWIQFSKNIIGIIDAMASGNRDRLHEIWQPHVALVSDYLSTEIKRRQ